MEQIHVTARNLSWLVDYKKLNKKNYDIVVKF